MILRYNPQKAGKFNYPKTGARRPLSIHAGNSRKTRDLSVMLSIKNEAKELSRFQHLFLFLFKLSLFIDLSQRHSNIFYYNDRRHLDRKRCRTNSQQCKNHQNHIQSLSTFRASCLIDDHPALGQRMPHLPRKHQPLGQSVAQSLQVHRQCEVYT